MLCAQLCTSKAN